MKYEHKLVSNMQDHHIQQYWSFKFKASMS